MNPSYPALAQSLTEALALTVPPVTVTATDHIPTGVPIYQGQAPAGCSFWQEAATSTFATQPSDHGLCAIGMYTHNLERSAAEDAELGAALGVFAELGYVRPEDVPHIPVLKQRRHYVIYAPLAEAPLPPDVVLLFVRPSQTLILAEAAEQVDGHYAPAMGRPACAVVPAALNTNAPALSLGCCGAHAYVDALQDDTALYALPGARIEAYAERIIALARANQVLSRFHQLRKKDVAAGARPTIAESLKRLGTAG